MRKGANWLKLLFVIHLSTFKTFGVLGFGRKLLFAYHLLHATASFCTENLFHALSFPAFSHPLNFFLPPLGLIPSLPPFVDGCTKDPFQTSVPLTSTLEFAPSTSNPNLDATAAAGGGRRREKSKKTLRFGSEKQRFFLQL